VVPILRSKQATITHPDTNQTPHSDRERDGSGTAGCTRERVGGGLEGERGGIKWMMAEDIDQRRRHAMQRVNQPP